MLIKWTEAIWRELPEENLKSEVRFSDSVKDCNKTAINSRLVHWQSKPMMQIKIDLSSNNILIWRSAVTQLPDNGRTEPASPLRVDKAFC